MLTLLQIKKNIQTDLKEVNKIIESTLLNSSNKTLTTIYQHILSNNGKQIRAALMILVFKMQVKNCTQDLYKIAAAIELIHLASLVHDDIIDDANIRRNQETVYKKFGINNGIITGVHIYSKALLLISDVGNFDVLNKISETVTNLCEGECYQVNNRHNFKLDEKTYWNIIYLKTSSLFESAIECACILNNTDESTKDLLIKFGNQLGDLFQLSDDYLDLFDTSNKLNKSIEQDLKTGDISLPILIAANKIKSNNTDDIKNYLKKYQTEIKLNIKEIITSKQKSLKSITNQLKNKTSINELNAIVDLIANRTN
tara:strand:- start:790 stop:1728 length:939 start_codon:yes stop_codon:yes gene_type:complete